MAEGCPAYTAGTGRAAHFAAEQTVRLPVPRFMGVRRATLIGRPPCTLRENLYRNGAVLQLLGEVIPG